MLIVNVNMARDIGLCSPKVLAIGAILAPILTMSRERQFESRPRNNLRLEAELWKAIDAARRQRPGSVSRNTWITEAVLEKLKRDGIDTPKTGGSDV